MTSSDNSKLSGVQNLRFSRYDSFGNAIFQIGEEFAQQLNEKAVELGCTNFPAREFNGRFSIKMKTNKKNFSKNIIAGKVSVKLWKYGTKSGLSTNVSDFIEDPNLNRYEDIPPFGWIDDEL